MGRAYRGAMASGSIRRRTIALIAAYAVALQTLLASFVPMAAAAHDPLAGPLAGSLAALCSHDAADGRGGQPAQHDLPCAALCAAMGQGIAGPVPSGMAIAAAAPQSIPAIVPAGHWAPPHIVPTGIHAPRGPPLA